MATRAAATELTRERILEAAVEAFSTRWYDEVTLRGVAEAAGVALQTVRNHFAAKDELFVVALERISAAITSLRWSVAQGDIDGAIDTLVDDYEQTGEMILRLLAIESRVPVVQPIVARGRAGHQEWVEHVFAEALQGLRGDRRSRRLAQLVVVTDVYTWKLLRIDRRFDRPATVDAMRELVLALHHKPEEGTDE